MKLFSNQLKLAHQSQVPKGVALCAQKFHQSIVLFMRVCQLFCAAPLNLKFISSPLDHVTTRRERCYRYSHAIWCVTVLLCILTSTYFQYLEFDSNELAFLTRILYFGEYISGMVNSAIIIGGCHYQRGRYGNYFHRLVAIDWKIHVAGGKMCYATARLYLRRMLGGYLFFFTVVIITDFMYNRMQARSFFRSSTVYSIPNVISVLALTQYFFLLVCLRLRYRQIIEILTWLPQDQRRQLNQTPMNGKMNLGMAIMHANRVSRVFDVVPPPDVTMESMRQVCLDLTDLYSEVNGSFGVLIITTVVSTFLILSIQFYALYTFMENLQRENTWLTIYTVLWIILHGGKSFLILYYNNVVNKEVI